MSNKHQKKYFTFPIILLQGFMDSPKSCISDIGSYAFFVKYKELIVDFEDTDGAVRKANQYYGNMFTDTNLAIKRGMHISNEVRKQSLPFSSISVDMAKDFAHNQKSEIQMATLLSFLAMKSIAGSNDGAVKTNKQLLFSRMAGLAKPLAKPHGTNFEAYDDEFLKTIPEALHKYYHRRGWEKVRNQLQVHWGVQYYSYRIRGFYFSFKMPLEALVKHAESKRMGLQLKDLKAQTKAAREKAVKELYPNLKSDPPKGT
jgi:hypothetical protein